MTNLPDHIKRDQRLYDYIERDQRLSLTYHEGQVDNLRKAIAAAERDIANPAHGDTERDCRALIAKWESMLPGELAQVANCLHFLGELPETPPAVAPDVPTVAVKDASDTQRKGSNEHTSAAR